MMSLAITAAGFDLSRAREVINAVTLYRSTGVDSAPVKLAENVVIRVPKAAHPALK